MNLSESKRLVRGLKDISPLFVSSLEEKIEPRRAPEIQVLGVSSPGGDGDSLFLNSFFATQMAAGEKKCSLVSLLSRQARISQQAAFQDSEPFGDHLQRHCIYWDELRDLVSHPPQPREGVSLKDRDIFLDFEYRHVLQFEQVLCLLDKWILLLKPTAESLTEGYKMMKAGISLNPQISFFITLEGPAEAQKGELIFERFSDFVHKYLHTNLGWLGWVDLSDPERHFSAALHTDLLLYQSWAARPYLGKFALAQWIDSLECKGRPLTFPGGT